MERYFIIVYGTIYNPWLCRNLRGGGYKGIFFFMSIDMEKLVFDFKSYLFLGTVYWIPSVTGQIIQLIDFYIYKSV